MVAICSEIKDYSIPSDVITTRPKRHVYSYFYEVRDTDLPGGRAFMGASFHQNLQDRTSFFQDYWEKRKIKEKGSVPYTYYLPIEEHEFIVNLNFYEFLKSQDYLRSTKGVFVLEPNLIHMLRFKLVEYNFEPLEAILKKSGQEYKPELMSEKKLLTDIAEDTRFWYADLNLRINLE